MLEINEETRDGEDGSYQTRSIKLSHLGVNQGVELTPVEVKADGVGQFGQWYLYEVVYHKSDGDHTVTLFPSAKLKPKLDGAIGKRIKVTKVQKKNSRGTYTTYDVDLVGDSTTTASSPSLATPQIKLEKTPVNDDGEMFEEKEIVDMLNGGGIQDKNTWIKTFEKYKVSEERATILYDNRKSI